MKNKFLKDSLKKEAKSVYVPNVLKDIKSQVNLTEIKLQETTIAKKKALKFKWISILATACVIVLVFSFAIFPKMFVDEEEYATVVIEFNENTKLMDIKGGFFVATNGGFKKENLPKDYSIALVLNKDDVVIDFKIENENSNLIDCKKFLNKKLDIIIREIIKNAKKEGILQQEDHEMLLEIVGLSEDKEAQLKKKVENCMEKAFKDNKVNGKFKWQGKKNNKN